MGNFADRLKIRHDVRSEFGFYRCQRRMLRKFTATEESDMSGTI